LASAPNRRSHGGKIHRKDCNGVWPFAQRRSDMREGIMGRSLKVAVASLALALSPHAASAQALKLGVLATLSGAGTAWGIAMQGAAELAAEDVNGKGGLDVGGKKYKVEVVAYD